MELYSKIISKEEKISVIGLGYVGLPLAVAFSRHINVIGFDINKEKIEKYKNGNDVTMELGDRTIKECKVEFTFEEAKLKESKFHIVAVPTPVSINKSPDLEIIINASRIIGRNLQKGSVVVYESTVYPGVTEEICIPILEKESGLLCGTDFKVGYSPERINPGDKVNTLESIVKVVSAIDQESLNLISKIYELVIKKGIYKAESIMVAEASKIVENSQRDINIAFMNELSLIFNRMNIDTREVLKAAGTKWNFLNFRPGLVGGHCIGVDPYYFIYKAEQLGYHSQIILSGRKINDKMSDFVVENTVKLMINNNLKVNKSKVIIMGITFKANCPDTRNSKIFDIINKLQTYGIEIHVYDPIANSSDVESEYGVKLIDKKEIKNADSIIFAVDHDQFKEIDCDVIKSMYKPIYYGEDRKFVLLDVKGLFNKKQFEESGFLYWRL